MPFTEKDVSRDQAAAQEMVQRSGQTGVPVIAVGQQMVVGFDQPALEQLLGSEEPPFRLGARVANARSGGAYVGRVRPGSAAERAGIKTGDVILALNDHAVADSAELERRLSGAGGGARVRVLRDGTAIDLRLPTG